jgi:hypothetical protein
VTTKLKDAAFHVLKGTARIIHTTNSSQNLIAFCRKTRRTLPETTAANIATGAKA